MLSQVLCFSGGRLEAKGLKTALQTQGEGTLEAEENQSDWGGLEDMELGHSRQHWLC
jgi:hypothetical protein